jgi:hypothetical protein
MTTKLLVQLFEDSADDERLDELTRFVRSELLALTVDDVAPVRHGEAPARARAIDGSTVGELLVTLGQSASGLREVFSVLRGWLSRDNASRRSIKVQIDGDVIEISAASKTEQDKLVDLFVSRHAGMDK